MKNTIIRLSSLIVISLLILSCGSSLKKIPLSDFNVTETDKYNREKVRVLYASGFDKVDGFLHHYIARTSTGDTIQVLCPTGVSEQSDYFIISYYSENPEDLITWVVSSREDAVTIQNGERPGLPQYVKVNKGFDKKYIDDYETIVAILATSITETLPAQ